MNIIIVGCGRSGAALAYRLFQAGHLVSVVDRNKQSFANLPSDFTGRVHEGDALSQDVLVRAGVEHADGLAAVTSSDSVNLVAGRVAKELFHVPNVVVRNYEHRYRRLYEDFGLQVVSSIFWGAQRMEEMLSEKGMHTVFSAGNGEVEIYELLVTSEFEGKNLEDVLSQSECVTVSLTRAGVALIPNKDLILKEDDIVHISATFNGINCLREKMAAMTKEA